MTLARFLVPVSALLLLAGCGLVAECDSGSIDVSVQKPGWPSLFGGAAKGDLPSSFDFSSAEFAEAITGIWSDSEKGVTLTLAPSDPAEVYYSVAEDGAVCITESTLEVTGEMGDSVETATLAGTFSSSDSIEGANLDIGDETRSCWFEYGSGADTGTTLYGSCLIQDSDGEEEATSEEFLLVKSQGV